MAYTFSLTFKCIYRSIMASKLRTSVNEHLKMFEAVAQRARMTQSNNDLSQTIMLLDEVINTLVGCRNKLEKDFSPYLKGKRR